MSLLYKDIKEVLTTVEVVQAGGQIQLVFTGDSDEVTGIGKILDGYLMTPTELLVILQENKIKQLNKHSNNMKTFAITYLSKESNWVQEIITVQTETIDLALQGFRGGKVVGIKEVHNSGKNL